MQEGMQHEAWQLLQPGQAITISTESPYYRGCYLSTVMGHDPLGVRVEVPVDQNKLVLLPVGTPVRIQVELAEGLHEFKAWVSERHTGENRYLMLATLQTMRQAEADKKNADDRQEASGRRIPVWAITSGKGGTGKTTTVVNLALALIEQGQRVCVIDGDLGTANVDIVLNLAPHYTLNDVVMGRKHILEAVIEGPKGMVILPGGSGLQELTQLCDADFEHLLNQFRLLERYTDVMLIDTSSGLSRSVTNFLVAAGMAILVTTPEPPSITDAYALIKVLARAGHRLPMQLVINKARNADEARAVMEKIVFAARRFLNYELNPLGYISDDEMVEKAVREQVALITNYPRAKAANDFRTLAAQLSQGEIQQTEESGTRTFLKRLRDLLTGRDKTGAII